MSKSVSSISQREQFIPTQRDGFLWWLSTAERELIKECVVDRNRFKIIGATVLATWSFATLAWTYFWTTITDILLLSGLLGIFMGLIILTIDRALIKGMNKFNKNKVAPLLLRSILAITLGTFMAQPAILFMFDKEIKLQASLDNEVRKRAKQKELDSLFNPQKETLITEKAHLLRELLNKYNAVSNAREQFLSEIDGTGGSGKIGIDKIAMAKKTEYEKLDLEYNQINASLLPRIHSIDSILTEIRVQVAQENKVYMGLLNNGFLTRIEALNNLVRKNNALQWRYFLIIVILMLIELMPVLAKTLLPAGTYDEKVKLTEEMEKEIAEGNQVKDKELKELYNRLAHENDKNFIEAFFVLSTAGRNEKMKSEFAKWSEGGLEPFDGFWERFKKDMLTKQEN